MARTTRTIPDEMKEIRKATQKFAGHGCRRDDRRQAIRNNIFEMEF